MSDNIIKVYNIFLSYKINLITLFNMCNLRNVIIFNKILYKKIDLKLFFNAIYLL